jgi:hypothetical protein
MLEDDLPTAIAERLRLRAAMQAAFADGLLVEDFDPVRREYILTRD